MNSIVNPENFLGKCVSALLLIAVPVVSLNIPTPGYAAEKGSAQDWRTSGIELPDAFKEDWVPPAPVLTPREINLNKAAPVSSPVMRLPKDRKPTLQDIAKTRILGTPLLAVGKSKQDALHSVENDALVKMLNAVGESKELGELSKAALLQDFVAKHPDSRFKISLLIDAADIEWRHGFFKKGLESLQRAWDESKDLTETNEKRLSEMALAGLLKNRSLLGQKQELKALIEAASKRALGGYATEALIKAKEVQWFLENEAERNIFCGFTAANAICVPLGDKPIFPDIHDDEEEKMFVREGLSAFELKVHSREEGGSLRVIKRTKGDTIVVPSVVHFDFTHFSAITEEKDGQYRVTDDHLQFDSWVPKEALEEQMTGIFLVPDEVKTPEGYVEVPDEEAKQHFGRHCNHARDDESCPVKFGGNEPEICEIRLAMATYTFNMMNPGLFVTDTPIQHRPPYGPHVEFQVGYDQRSSVIADLQTVGNLGPRWIHQFAEAITLTGTGTPNTQVRYISGSGAYFKYTYNTSTASYSQRYKEQPRMSYIAPVDGGPGYQLTYSDNSKKLFKQYSSLAPAKYLLTQIIDPIGNALTLQYDVDLRLTNIVDALGQATTIGYTPDPGDNVSSDIYKIRSVTDPFSRVAKFKYTSTGQLQKIIDPVGIESVFNYGDGDFINKVTTPYGPMEFSCGDLPGINSEPGRWIESKDAQGARERVEANDLALPTSYSANPAAPSIVNVGGTNVSFLPKNDNLFYRNTFYWDRQQMHWHPNDYSKCRIYNFLTSTADTVTAVVGSIKDPLEGRVWFNYPGQTSSHGIGNVSQPSKIVRAVENNSGVTTWTMSQTTYNDLGLVTGTVDAQGRELKYEYHPNNRDVQYVKVKNGGNWETLLTTSQYNQIGGVSTGLPEIMSNASGLQTEYTYNSKGQVTEVTRSKGANSETSRYIYDNNLDGTPDADGYLIRIEHTSPSNPGQYVTLESYTYDFARRVLTKTDLDGYTLTYDYNAIDLVTQVTHPDSTTEQYVYTDGTKQTLDVWAQKDRAGRWNRMRYSQHRQLLMHLDPLLRLTQYAWCLCGQIRQLIDPMGKITTWNRDAQGRVTEKLLSDGNKYLYTYQPLSGRLATVAYPKDVLVSQATASYAYHLDGTVQKLDYTDPGTPDVTYAMADYLGRSTSATDGIGTTTMSYISLTGGLEGAGRVSTIDGPWNDDTLRYGYDWRNNNTQNEIVADDGVTVTRVETATLDSLKRASQVVNNLGTFNYTYASGNLSHIPDSVSLPGGFSTEYSRYPTNAGANALQLQTIHHKQGANTVQKHDYTYDLTGNITHWSRANGSANVTSWDLRHDPADQLSELKESLDGVPQKTESWHYDAAGNMASTVNLPAGGAGTMEIRNNTGRNQLTQLGGTGKTLVEGTVDEAATVEVNGEPAKVTKLGPTGPWRYQKEMSFGSGTTNISVEATDGNSNVTTQNYSVSVSASADQTLEYDANGNVVKVRDASNTVVRVYEWDAQNRLIAIQSPEAMAMGTKRTEFGYDGVSRRVLQAEKEYNGSVWQTLGDYRYCWAGYQLAQKRDAGSNNVLMNYFMSGEQQGSDLLVYQTDHLGSPRNWYRVSDGQQGSAEYTAYGERTVTSTGPGVTERGYTGHLVHEATGLLLAPFRAYDPELGRWLSEDPIGEDGGLNLYGYVGNEPIRYIDPTGENPIFLIVIGALLLFPDFVNAPGPDDPVYGGDPAGIGVMGKCLAGTVGSSTLPAIFDDLTDALMPPDHHVPPSNEPRPPGYDPETWEYGPGNLPSEGPRYRDPQGGEWRRHCDEGHTPHWDYRKNDNWNSPWRNVDDDGQFVFPFKNSRR